MPVGFTASPASCSSDLEYYFSAAGTGSGEVLNPSDAPAATHTPAIGTFTEVYSDDFEDDASDLAALLGNWG